MKAIFIVFLVFFGLPQGIQAQEIRKISKSDLSEILKNPSDKLHVVNFWATWCGPCRMMAPVVEELDAEHPEYKFGKVNVDEQPELAGQFRIMSIPTLMVFRGGQAAAVKIGVTPKEELLKLLG